MSIRQSVVNEARSWLGTPWGHNQCVKGNQVDCVRFVNAVAQSCGIVCGDLPKEYARLSNGIDIINYLDQWFKPKSIDDLKDGDILVFKYWGRPHHVALATTLRGYRGMIHASVECGKVTEHILDNIFLRILVAVYDLGVD